MPIPLLALAISAFAIGTTEFVIMGLLPEVARDLAVSLPSAGLLVSGYALGVAVGDPLLLVTRTAYDRNDVPVEFSYDYFRSDRTRIRVKSGVDRGPDAAVETSPAS